MNGLASNHCGVADRDIFVAATVGNSSRMVEVYMPCLQRCTTV